MQSFNLIFIFILSGSALWANDFDEEVIDKLKIEATHDVDRLRSFRKELENNRIFANEREKGLGEFLEDQEKWDLIRERGLREYIKHKTPQSDMDETSEEYRKDQEEKQLAEDRYEKSREIHVRTRNKIHSQIPKNLTALEAEELQIFVDRPRFDVRKKRKNKWAGAGKPGGGGSTASAPSFQNPAQPPAINDFVPPPPPPDFPAAPAPYEGFEELPPPPMYDSNMNTSVPYDPSFGGEMSIPPPPPPPPDYNF